MRVLLKFWHGLGDCAQFTVILKHLAKYRPNNVYDVVTNRGKESAFAGLCRAAFFDGQPRPADSSYDEVVTVGWHENYNQYRDRPNSKVTNSLAEEFGLGYDTSLASYTINYTAEHKERARAFLEGRGARFNASTGKCDVIALHYEGNTSTARKNLGHHHARAVCEAVAANGGRVLLFDWDNRSPLSELTTVITAGVGAGDVWGGFGSGDAAMIAALVDQCAGFIGIDSGPGKVASSTAAPSLIVWTGHHPLQFHDPAENTTHLVPDNHVSLPPISGNSALLDYFKAAYTFKTYKPNELGYELCRAAVEMLGGKAHEVTVTNLVPHGPFMVRKDNFDQDLVIVQDVFFGDCYRTSLYDLTQWRNVVDVGSHIGTFSKIVHTRNPRANIACVEACPENINALTVNVGAFATVCAGAMTYEPGELALLNSVRPGCESTGGSVVVRREDLANPNHPLRQHGYQYRDDLRPLRKYSLGEVMRAAGMTHVDCLKLDCEGAEYSILENAPEVARHVRFVFGEYHDKARWEKLRAERFADWQYGLMYECEGGRGIFHLINPRFDPTAPLPDEAERAPEPAKTSEPAAIVKATAREGDVDFEMHAALTLIMRAAFQGGAPTIIETGIKHGFSALAMFDALPDARIIGYDFFVDPTGPEDREKAWRNLATHVRDGLYTFVTANTNLVTAYPSCDAFYVDGDHTFAGATNDLNKASLCTSLIVVDDYYPDEPHHSVTNALNWFLLQSPFNWRFTVVPCGAGGRYLAVLVKDNAFPPRAELGAPWGGVLKVATVAGIGDTAWAVTKLPGIIARLGASGADVFTCQSDRATEYLKKLPFVRRVGATSERIIESAQEVTPWGAYNYAPSQPGWHNRFHLFLQANGELECGNRLETWFPYIKTDYAAPINFTDRLHEQVFADEFAAKGKYVTAFAGPFDGNTAAGHNVGGAWTPHDWAHVARELTSKGVRLVLLGYGPGDADYNLQSLYPAGFYDTGAEDCVNLWELPKTLAVIRRAAAHVGYQSGLGILSTYFGIPTCMFWNRYGVHLNDKGATFSEAMAHAWVPGGRDNPNFLPAYYGRTDAATVANWLLERVTKGKL